MKFTKWDEHKVSKAVEWRAAGFSGKEIAERLYKEFGFATTQSGVRNMFARFNEEQAQRIHAAAGEPYGDIQDTPTMIPPPPPTPNFDAGHGVIGHTPDGRLVYGTKPPERPERPKKPELPPRKAREDVVNIHYAQPGPTRIFAFASDIHIGSKTHLEDAFLDFVHRAYEQGVRVILGPGDILDGVYEHSKWEQSRRGFDDQANHAATIFPELPGLSYHMIAGNHDQTFEKDSGMNVCAALEDVFRAHGREDFHMLGHRGAYVNLRAPGEERGLLVELWHPTGRGAYALSYKQQRKIEEYAPGKKPDVMANGHWHQQCYFVQRGIHVLSCGTFQGGHSPFGRSIGTTPAIGGWIVRYAQTEEGTVREFCPSWQAYYEHETVREIALP